MYDLSEEKCRHEMEMYLVLLECLWILHAGLVLDAREGSSGLLGSYWSERIETVHGSKNGKNWDGNGVMVSEMAIMLHIDRWSSGSWMGYRRITMGLVCRY